MDSTLDFLSCYDMEGEEFSHQKTVTGDETWVS